MAETRKRVGIPTEFEAGRLAGRGRVGNVSTSGLFVSTRCIPERGEAVRLCLNPVGWPQVEVSGMVWWTTLDSGRRHAEPGFGLRLLDDNDEYRRLIDHVR